MTQLEQQIALGEHGSASQIDTYRDCHRKWAFRYIDGAVGEVNRFAEWGTVLHKRLQVYSNTGDLGDTNDDDFKIILPAIEHIPPPKTGAAEPPFTLETEHGPLIGFIDLTDFVDDQNRPVNVDYKTTSNLKWALTEEELRSNVQSVLYAVRTLEKYQTDECVNRWIYLQRSADRPKAKKVEVVMNLAEVAKHWDGVLEDFGKMKQLRESGVTAKDVAYNALACDKYGGCPFKSICGLSPMERLRSLTNMQSMKEKMAAKKVAGTAAPAATTAPVAPPAQTAPAAASGAGSAVNPPAKAASTGAQTALQRMQAQKAAGGAAPAPAATTPPVQDAKAERERAWKEAKAKEAADEVSPPYEPATTSDGTVTREQAFEAFLVLVDYLRGE